MAEIVTLPRWKKNATAYERLSELALLAKEQPEKFTKFALVYEEQLANGNVKPRILSFCAKTDNLNYLETMGLFQAGIFSMWNKSVL